MGEIVKYILHTTGKIKETYLIYINLSNLLFIIFEIHLCLELKTI